MPDVTAQVAQMKANELDVIWEVEPSLIEAVRGIPSAVIHKKDAPYYNWFLLNQKHPLFKDRRVRQAIAMAFDKETIANKILKGMVTPASGPVQPAIKWAYPKDVKGLPYDPARAKKLLAEAGWKPGPGGILQNSKGEKFTFEISGDKGNPTRELMFLVSRQMLGKIGIDATVKLYEFNALMKIYRGGRYASRFAYWITPPDPDVTDYFGTGGGRNFIVGRDALRQGERTVAEPGFFVSDIPVGTQDEHAMRPARMVVLDADHGTQEVVQSILRAMRETHHDGQVDVEHDCLRVFALQHRSKHLLHIPALARDEYGLRQVDRIAIGRTRVETHAHEHFNRLG